MDKQALEALGASIQSKLTDRISDRSALEQQWLRNLRQFRGIYDPEVEKMLEPGRSRAYPRDTRTKVKGFVGKMMEMLFPATEENWELTVSDIPDLPEDAKDTIFTALQGAYGTSDVPSDVIEQAVKAEAEVRKNRMQTKIHDQLMDKEVDWPSIAKRVIRSGGIYGIGIVKSPMVRKKQVRTWERQGSTYVPKNSAEKRPYPEFVRVWDIYPELTAGSWDDQDSIFERMVVSAHGLRELKKRPGFIPEAIDEYLRNNPSGNYQSRSFESSLDALNISGAQIATKKSRSRFEVFRYCGFIEARELEAIGLTMSATGEVFADIWIIDNVVIAADLAPFGERPSDVYHAYIYAEDEEAGLTGVGMPVELRDRQMSICAGTRALYDNMAASAGPIIEVAVDALTPQQRASLGSIHSFQTIKRHGEGAELAYPVLREININSHSEKILSVLAAEREQFDLESNLPSWMLGNAQPLGEAFRTSSNMSQMMGGATMITKDHVRAFDKFTSSVIGSILAWNMEFLDDDTLKCDLQVRARGNLSLVAKEIRGVALDQFMSVLTPGERDHIDERYVLEERARSRDLLVDRMFVTPEVAAQRAQARMASIQQSAAIEDGLKQAKTQKTLADAQKVSTLTQIEAAKFEDELQYLRAQVGEIMARTKDTALRAQMQSVDRLAQGMIDQVKGAQDAVGRSTEEAARIAEQPGDAGA